MGLVYADITLVNSFDITAAKKGLIAEGDIKKLEVRAMVDSGASMLTISDVIADQLDLDVVDNLEVELADGSHSKRQLVGPVTVRFKNRITNCSALVFPGINEVLLGAIPMEGMDVIIDPLAEQLMVHPDRPHRALLKVK
jgi:clan AA aspartic protease